MKRIKLTQSQFAIVDNKNYEWLNKYKWYAAWDRKVQSFYAMRRSKKVDGEQYLISMAREILGLKRGDKKQPDHINHKTLDNRELNLRVVTHRQNQFNRKTTKGYCWYKRCEKYYARIQLNGKVISLGYFDTAKEAHNTYLKAKERYHKI